jgi:RNA-directed DNA polymerase
VALSVLDEHFAEAPGGPRSTTKQRWTRRQKGLPNYRLYRYADDFVILVAGTRSQTEALLPEVATVLSTVGLRLSVEKTLITHIDEGFDFLGWRIQRHQKRGTNRHYVYNYPAKKALRSIKAKCKTICRMNVSLPLAVLLHQLNSVLRGWTAYFRPGVSSRAFGYLRMIVWRQVFGWLRRKHPNPGWKNLRRRYCDGTWWPRDGEVVLCAEDPAQVNALCETTIGLYKTESVRDGSPFRTGPIHTLADLENITSAWVAWYNVRRLMHRLKRRPPAEAEAEYARLHAGKHTGHT